jgi:hypothetical protein
MAARLPNQPTRKKQRLLPPLGVPSEIDTAQLENCFAGTDQPGHVIRAPEPKTYAQRVQALYGLTPEAYFVLRMVQGNKCAICGKLPISTGNRQRLHVDHDHVTGRVRGLLCPDCNRGLGSFHDNPGFLTQAAAYLRRGV